MKILNSKIKVDKEEFVKKKKKIVVYILKTSYVCVYRLG